MPLSVGIYQQDTFRREEKYGLTVLTTNDDGLLNYLNQIMSQVEAWLLTGDVQRLVVVVAGIDSGETLERWQFNVAVDESATTSGPSSGAFGNDENMPQNGNRNGGAPSMSSTTKKPTTGSSIKGNQSLKEIHDEIQAIIRQITASVTFLPLLSEPCAFDLLVYTNKEAAVPKKWFDSDPRYILNSQEVKLRSFTTSVCTHQIEIRSFVCLCPCAVVFVLVCRLALG